MIRSPLSVLVLGLLAFTATPGMSQTPENSRPGNIAADPRGPWIT